MYTSMASAYIDVYNSHVSHEFSFKKLGDSRRQYSAI